MALPIGSPPARSPCRHNPSLAAPPVRKIMKPTKRERKSQQRARQGLLSALSSSTALGGCCKGGLSGESMNDGMGGRELLSGAGAQEEAML